MSQENRDAAAEEMGRRHAHPEIRSMYPTTSRGEMAKQFAQLFSLGWDQATQEAEKRIKELEADLGDWKDTAHLESDEVVRLNTKNAALEAQLTEARNLLSIAVEKLKSIAALSPEVEAAPMDVLNDTNECSEIWETTARRRRRLAIEALEAIQRRFSEEK